MQSDLKQHPYMRSFAWVFSLPNLPELHFDKWHFFDAIVKKAYARQNHSMNLVYGGHHHLNILLKFLKKAMGLIPSQDCQKIGIQEAILKRKALTRVMGMCLKSKEGEFIVR